MIGEIIYIKSNLKKKRGFPQILLVNESYSNNKYSYLFLSPFIYPSVYNLQTYKYKLVINYLFIP